MKKNPERIALEQKFLKDSLEYLKKVEARKAKEEILAKAKELKE